MRKLLLCLAAVIVSLAANAEDKVKVTVSNPLPFSRSDEMVELDIKDLNTRLGSPASIIVTDADGREIPSQQTYDGKLIFQPGVGANGKSVYYVQAGNPQSYPPKVFGRQFPERVDDFAWENDRVAFRTYGPALQRSGERAWGYDIWNKRTDRLVVEERYSGELDSHVSAVCNMLRKRGENDLADDLYNAVSYHVDHGTGMDCYKVGPTLGAGTTAILENEGKDIHYPKCYVDYEILDKGPLRLTFRLNYGKESVEGDEVTEQRTITLDAGSQLNKCVVHYEGMSHDHTLATGIIVHNENPSAFVLNKKCGFMGYEDLGDPKQYKEKYRAKQNKDFGHIYVGAVFANTPDEMELRPAEGLPGACAHILSISRYTNGSDYTYYFGTGWSRNPNTKFQTLGDWEAYLLKYSQQVNSPLKVKF